MKKKIKWGQRSLKLSEERWELVTGHTNLVDIALNMFKSKYFSANFDLDDYREAGTWGLIHAARKFNFDEGVKFSTYALPAIRRDIKRVYDTNAKRRQRFKSREALQEFLGDQTNGCEQNVVSPTTESDIISDLITKEQLGIIKDIMKNAPDQHRKIFQWRFVENMTFQQIGEQLGVTREMARLYCKDAVSYAAGKLEKINA